MKNNEMIEKFYNDLKLCNIGELKPIDEITSQIIDRTGKKMIITYLHDGIATNRNDIICYIDSVKIGYRFQNKKWILIKV